MYLNSLKAGVDRPTRGTHDSSARSTVLPRCHSPLAKLHYAQVQAAIEERPDDVINDSLSTTLTPRSSARATSVAWIDRRAKDTP